jgi:hypothetical protein
VNQESTKGCFKTFSLNDWEKRGGPWEERIWGQKSRHTERYHTGNDMDLQMKM